MIEFEVVFEYRRPDTQELLARQFAIIDIHTHVVYDTRHRAQVGTITEVWGPESRTYNCTVTIDPWLDRLTVAAIHEGWAYRMAKEWEEAQGE